MYPGVPKPTNDVVNTLAGIVVRKTERKNPTCSLGDMAAMVEEVFLVVIWESLIAEPGRTVP